MRIIALMNQKGGVGKTTTTVNLGAALAEAGKKVCLIDLDPQAHLTINYGIEPGEEMPSVYDLLVEQKPLSDVLRPAGEKISLVPSSIDLAAAEVEMVSVLGRESILKKRLQEAGGDYDFVLLDCPPSLGLLTINALAAASEVIIPMQAHFLALQGVAKLLETVQLVQRRLNPHLKVTGIVLTMFDSNTKLSNEVVAELERFIGDAKGKQLPWSEAKIFRSRIRRNIKLAESPGFGQTILAYGPESNGAADYRALAAEVLEMDRPAIEVTINLPDNLALKQPAGSPTSSLERCVSENVRLWFRWPIWIATIIFWLSCIYMTHVPRPPSFTDVVTWDKLKHFSGFGVLASLLYLSLWVKGIARRNTLIILILVLAAYGALDERTQPWTGRDCDIHDWYADVCGTVFAGLFWTMMRAMMKQMPE